ncbi:MAG: hypothetical protein IJY32_00545 [Mogibacterium sp.]|nr:hypothetical protein [Mogibacterium sp.]
MVDKRKLKKSLYTAGQWTWGLPQTLAGAGLYLRHRKDPHFEYNGAKVTAWDRDSGVSLGKFIFVPAEKRRQGGSGDRKNVKVNSFLLDHEYGHTIQSLLFGPAYLFLVGIPSFAWNRLPYFDRKRKKTGKSYYSAVFERTASEFGSRAAKRSSKVRKKKKEKKN